MEHMHRHAVHAFADFRRLRRLKNNSGEAHRLWHSLSHHLRHVVYRTGLELPSGQRTYIRRSDNA